MSKLTKIGKILKETKKLKDRNLAGKIRMSAIDAINKSAQQNYGILQDFDSKPNTYSTREHKQVGRGGKDDSEKLYGVGLPDHQKSDLSVDRFDRSLSTRYSPDRVGVQARRIADGVYQDPITNKIYDWNDGFKTEDGETFTGGGVALQSDIIHRS